MEKNEDLKALSLEEKIDIMKRVEYDIHATIEMIEYYKKMV